MKIDNLHLQKLSLGSRYTKKFNDLFEKYINSVNSDDVPKEDIEKASNSFDKDIKKLHNVYEAERYKIDIQEKPSVHTMYSAINYKQSILVEAMNDKLKAEYKELNRKLSSSEYDFFEKIKLKEEYEEFKDNLKNSIFKEIDEFKLNYYQALKTRNYTKIDKLENGLLSDLLLKL